MKKYFSISETAKISDLTAETLRHYDRIGLVKPCYTDPQTGYRYYSEEEIVKLNTVRALKCMDLSLAEIKKILEYKDFGQIIAALKLAENSADNKIAELNYAKAKISRAKAFYENKLQSEIFNPDIFLKTFPRRVILLSDTANDPTLENLWNYHRHFYARLPQELKNKFEFEDSAGIYEQNGKSHLFAFCSKYSVTDGLMQLPQGKYLCTDCKHEDYETAMEKLIGEAQRRYGIVPRFTVRQIILSGILQWHYRLQIFIP